MFLNPARGAALLCLALSACVTAAAQAPASELIGVEIQSAPTLPEDLTAAIPVPASTMSQRFRGPGHWSAVQYGLCAGDVERLEELDRAVHRSVRLGQDATTVMHTYLRLFRSCENDGYMDWVETRAADLDELSVALRYHLRGVAGQNQHRPLFRHPQAPPGAVLLYYRNRHIQRVDEDNKAVLNALHHGWSSLPDSLLADGVYTLLANRNDSAATSLAPLVNAGTPDAQTNLVYRLNGQSTQEAQLAVKVWCSAHPQTPRPCRSTEPKQRVDLAANLTRFICDSEPSDVIDTIKLFPEATAQVMNAVRDCDAQGISLYASLNAKGALNALPHINAQTALERSTVLSIASHKTSAVAKTRLRELGWTPAPGSHHTNAVDVLSILTAWGRVIRHDTETGAFPNEHDHMLRHVASLSRPHLDNWSFHEVVYGTDIDRATYVLTAYSPDGSSLTVPAANLGDWWDMPSILALMGQVNSQANLPWHNAVLYTGDQTTMIVAGPPAGLKALIDSGELPLGTAGAAEQTGKTFEQQVLERMRDQGKGVSADAVIGVD